MRNDKRTSLVLVLSAAAILLGACGGDDLTGFVVRAKVRGINIAAITQLQIRFEAGSAKFDSDSGSESGVSYATQDAGSTFTATAGRGWVTEHYELSASEFVFKMPFANPEGSGDTNLHVLIHRDIAGELTLVGESTLVPVRLPAGSGAEVEAVVGCVPDGQCAAGIN